MWWPLRRALVVGESMLPTYAPGDVVLWRAGGRRPRVGDAVVVALPGDRPLGVKRLGAQTAEGWVLVADNPEGSTDSREFGPVLASAIRGRVIRPLYRLRR